MNEVVSARTKTYCNVLAIQRGLDPVGSAGHFEDAVIIEIPLPWKKGIYEDASVLSPQVIELYARAAVFCCPSIYEPFGIINLEAMACETAVVCSAVGGIKEVVVNGETGFLVPVEQMTESPFEPLDPAKFSRDLAGRINELMANPELQRKFGKAGRKRAEEMFSWSAIAQETKRLYETLL